MCGKQFVNFLIPFSHFHYPFSSFTFCSFPVFPFSRSAGVRRSVRWRRRVQLAVVRCPVPRHDGQRAAQEGHVPGPGGGPGGREADQLARPVRPHPPAYGSAGDAAGPPAAPLLLGGRMHNSHRATARGSGNIRWEILPRCCWFTVFQLPAFSVPIKFNDKLLSTYHDLKSVYFW